MTPIGALAVGALAGVVCALAIGLKYRFGVDDSLDVVGVHLVGGLVGHHRDRPLRHGRRPPPASTACSTAAAVDQLWRQAVGGLRGLLRTPSS